MLLGLAVLAGGLLMRLSDGLSGAPLRRVRNLGAVTAIGGGFWLLATKAQANNSLFEYIAHGLGLYCIGRGFSDWSRPFDQGRMDAVVAEPPPAEPESPAVAAEAPLPPPPPPQGGYRGPKA